MLAGQRAVNEEQKGLRRNAILVAAETLFTTGSFEALSIEQVAKQASIAKGTVYLYFRTKEELFLALLTEEFERWFDEMDAGLAASTGRLSVRGFVEPLVRTLAERPVFVRLIAVMHSLLEHNIDLSTALSFKHMLRNRVQKTGALLELRLPFLGENGGLKLLLRIEALAIGIQHIAEPAPVIVEALRQPDLEMFRVDFTGELRSSLTQLLTGIETEWRRSHEH